MTIACRCLLVVSLVWFSNRVLPAADVPLRVGVAEADITPPMGFPMAGYYHERLATGMLNPLKARAVVFRDGDQQAAFVACDLIGITADLGGEVRRIAAERTGIPAANIMLAATHSHTAPDYWRHLYEYLGGQAKPADGAPPPYGAKLIGGIVEAIVQAHGRVQPAVVECGSVQQTTPVSFNRRFVMKDGSVQTWKRLDNPEVVKAAGPIDPEIALLAVRPAESSPTAGVPSGAARVGDPSYPIAVCWNFALHLDTVGGLQWSADYPFYVEQALRKKFGEKLVSVFGNGCCGDINHADPLAKQINKTDFIGGALAATVESGLAQLRRVEQPRLCVRSCTVPLPLQEVTAEQVAKAEQVVAQDKAGGKVEFFELVSAHNWLALDHLRNKPPLSKTADNRVRRPSHRFGGIGPALPLEVQTITLGRDVAIVAFPGEAFVNLGLAIKQASPFRTTFVVELSNCVETIYLPTRAAYAGGSYEVTNSMLQPGSGEVLVEAALRLLREAASSQKP